MKIICFNFRSEHSSIQLMRLHFVFIFGTGSSCNGISCPSGKSCEVNSRGQPWCVCDTICPTLFDPVCGSDGRTYSNGCQLIVASCQANKDITVSHDGECLTGKGSEYFCISLALFAATFKSFGHQCQTPHSMKKILRSMKLMNHILTKLRKWKARQYKMRKANNN